MSSGLLVCHFAQVMHWHSCAHRQAGGLTLVAGSALPAAAVAVAGSAAAAAVAAAGAPGRRLLPLPLVVAVVVLDPAVRVRVVAMRQGDVLLPVAPLAAVQVAMPRRALAAEDAALARHQAAWRLALAVACDEGQQTFLFKIAAPVAAAAVFQ